MYNLYIHIDIRPVCSWFPLSISMLKKRHTDIRYIYIYGICIS